MAERNMFYKIVRKVEKVVGYDYTEDYCLEDIVDDIDVKDHLMHTREMVSIYDLISGELLHSNETTGRYK